MRQLRLVSILGLLGIGLGPACAAPVQGELYIEDDEGRGFLFEPRECADGEELGQFGVELRDDDDRILEFFGEADAPTVIYYAPGEGAFSLDPDDCERFAGELTREYNRVTDNGRIRGDLELQCATADGWWVEGALSFEQCYASDDDDDG